MRQETMKMNEKRGDRADFRSLFAVIGSILWKKVVY